MGRVGDAASDQGGHGRAALEACEALRPALAVRLTGAYGISAHGRTTPISGRAGGGAGRDRIFVEGKL
jgi:hypothetical protein